MIAQHVGRVTGDGIVWTSVALHDDGVREVRRTTQEGLTPLRPPLWEGDLVQRVDVPDLVVEPRGFQRSLAYWLGPGVSDRACHRAELEHVRGGVSVCLVGQGPIEAEVRPVGQTHLGVALGAGAVFVAAVLALVVFGRWLSARARDEAREAYLRREL